MENYRVYLHLDLLEALPKRSAQKRRVLDFIRSLEQDPSAPGDFTDKDATLRVRQIKIIGDYAITYWADHPVKAVMIVDIQRAD
jgi:mRNA-degrading endonuclease RelE of RelBE toxin-antitoxin system